MANGHGGARKGAGAKPKTAQLKAAVVTMHDQLPKDALTAVMARLQPGANSLQMLRHVMDAPETPPDLKLKLATVVLPFEVPKPERSKDPDADNEKVKQASDERVKSRLAELLRKAGVAGSSDGRSAAGNAAPAEQVPTLPQAG